MHCLEPSMLEPICFFCSKIKNFKNFLDLNFFFFLVTSQTILEIAIKYKKLLLWLVQMQGVNNIRQFLVSGHGQLIYFKIDVDLFSNDKRKLLQQK